MFKKIASIVLAAAMMIGTAAITASAAETNEAVAAADETVGAADETVGAAEGDAVGAGNKVYFEVNTSLWKNFKTVRLYMYAHDGSDFPLNTWGSKKGDMEEEGDNIWSFDFDKKGYTVESGKQYGMIFCTDTGIQTCDIIFDSSVMGDTAYCTGDMVENNVDSNKKSYYVKWKNADPSKYAPPLCVTSIGNVIGEALWAGETKYNMLVNFIKSDGTDGLKNALTFNGKTAQQTLDEVAQKFGLGQDDIEKAIAESGKTVDWKKSSSSAQSGGTSGDSGNSGNSGSNNTSGNSGSSTTGGSSSSGSSSSGSSSSSSSSSGTSSVSSGEGETMILLFGGVMLAAAGVIFLMRKRRVD